MKSKISTKKWFIVFLLSVLVCGLLFVGLNVLADPFGVFGDKAMDWWSYDMTQNPRTAKIGYLDANHENYDSYIIGCSKTSSFPTEELNEYYDASFYNMLMYGGDMYDTEMTVKYILENYSAENIIINASINELVSFETESDPIKANLHSKVDGSSALQFYSKYLFAHPQYALDKLKAYFGDSYLVNANKVFDPETGAYDKSLRDIEPIGNEENYLARYPEFTAEYTARETLPAVQDCLDSLTRIIEMCDAAGVKCTILISPMYESELDIYNCADLYTFFRSLAQITDYWDFSGYTEVAAEARYFYDLNHFRNNVGTMMLARMFDNTSVYVPEDFGVYVTRENVESRLAAYDTRGLNTAENDIELPVLMYHSVTESGEGGDMTISAELFRAQLTALRDAGYETVTVSQIISYVEHGTPLPEKPLLITFDDGYANNLSIAAPILEELGMCAVISIIGVSDGKDTYKDTNTPITPHFAVSDAEPWIEKGIIEIGSHSYDMHQVQSLDGEDCRRGVLIMEGESEDDYIAALRADYEKSRDIIESATGSAPAVFAYPNGYYSDLSEVLLSEMGIKITLTSSEGINTIIKGLPQSLRALKRINITSDISASDIVSYLKGKSLND